MEEHEQPAPMIGIRVPIWMIGITNRRGDHHDQEPGTMATRDAMPAIWSTGHPRTAGLDTGASSDERIARRAWTGNPSGASLVLTGPIRDHG